MSELVDFLQERGFEPVDESSGWVTDGTVSVNIESQRGTGGLHHTVEIYRGAADSVNVTELLARSHNSSHDLALREAFDDAGDALEDNDTARLQLHVGDHVQDVDDDDDATMLVVATPVERADEYVVDGSADDGTAATIADYNADYPEDDRVLEVVFTQRTDTDLEDSRRYAYPRSRLRRTAAVHDVEDGQ